MKEIKSERADLPYFKQLIVDVTAEMDEITHPELKRVLFELLGQQALLHQKGSTNVTVEDVESKVVEATLSLQV